MGKVLFLAIYFAVTISIILISLKVYRMQSCYTYGKQFGVEATYVSLFSNQCAANDWNGGRRVPTPPAIQEGRCGVKHEIWCPEFHGRGQYLFGYDLDTDMEIVRAFSERMMKYPYSTRMTEYHVHIRRPGKKVAKYLVKAPHPVITRESLTHE